MRTLHAYLVKQVLATLAMTVLVFTLVLLLDNMRREIVALLVNHRANIGIVVEAVGLLIPFVLVFALPMGMLTASLLVFGRFSADNELTAVKASGVSLVSLVTPVILLSVLLSGLCAMFNLQLAPACRVAYKNLLYDLGSDHPENLITENRFIDDFPGYIVYVRSKDGATLKDVLIYKWSGDARMESRMHAQTGVLTIDQTNHQATLTLFKVQAADLVQMKSAYFEEYPVTLDLRSPKQKAAEPDLSEMTFTQLSQKVKDLEKMGVDATPALVQVHRQISFSFACIGFTLVGIPLGIRAHRRETSAGIAISLLLVLVYYSFFIVGQALKTRSELAPHLLLWAPNLIFQAVGSVMLWRANRGL